MTKIEMKTKVYGLLAAGTPKSQVFEQLKGKGVKDKHLARAIASYADPILCNQHKLKLNALIAIMFIQALLGFAFGFTFGMGIGPNAKWVLAGLTATVPLLFAWWFYRHRVTAFHVYIVLAMIQMPSVMKGFTTEPVETSFAILVHVGVLAYVCYVRDKLFPDFAFIWLKKLKGEYKFSS